jgi:hypothetical protein
MLREREQVRDLVARKVGKVEEAAHGRKRIAGNG